MWHTRLRVLRMVAHMVACGASAKEHGANRPCVTGECRDTHIERALSTMCREVQTRAEKDARD